MTIDDRPSPDAKPWRRGTAPRAQRPECQDDEALADDDEAELDADDDDDDAIAEVDEVMGDVDWTDPRPDFWRQFYDELLLTEFSDDPDEIDS